MGPSCSTYNPWPVDPDPRSVGRLGARLKAEPASNHDHRDPAQAAGRGRWGRTCDGGAGHCRKPHGLSLLRGPVSTALTLAGPTSVRPAGIVGILRFFLGEQSRLGVNVSAVDTDAPPDLFPSSCPRFQDHRPAKVPARASVSEVMTLRCLRSEETTQYPQGTTSSLRIRTRE